MFLPVARRREIAMIKVLSPLGEAAAPVQKFGAPRIRRRRCGQRETLGLEEDEHIKLAGIGKAIRAARGVGLCQCRSKARCFSGYRHYQHGGLLKKAVDREHRLSLGTLRIPSVNDRYPPVPVGSAHPMNDRLRRISPVAPPPNEGRLPWAPAVAGPGRQERVKVPQLRHSPQRWNRSG
jgi:hypothetical protein